ncbi:Glucose / Sorbosone dehydrogenase [uncultured archaeon]|nr:Glucose / Sorbosone dehydrogenase [uncultured archaeon]
MKKEIRLAGLIFFVVIVLAISYFSFLYTMKLNLEFGGAVKLNLVANNFVSPIDIEFPNDSSGRLFIVDRPGIIKILQNGTLLDEPFLDLTNKVVNLSIIYDERGLLGLAFHPDFKKNGKFYVYYNTKLRSSAPNGWDSTIRLSEFTVSKNSNKADQNSERVLLEFDKPYMNHNGGQILFGKDGYLYISVGDGGNANDVGMGHNATIGNGQDTFSILGKILRIDVDSKTSSTLYGIPKDNPFADGKNGLKEIYAYGFRNPWRMSFDAKNGNLFVGDAGQNIWEEISVVKKGGNYGWNIKEGTHCFSVQNPNKSPAQCSNVGYKGEPLIDPVIEYLNAQQKGGLGHTNVGGYMYYGKEFPQLYGKFIFGDWSRSFTKADGTLFVADPSEKGLWTIKQLEISDSKNMRLGEFILSLGHDSENELYLLTTGNTGPVGKTGKVYKLVKSG